MGVRPAQKRASRGTLHAAQRDSDVLALSEHYSPHPRQKRRPEETDPPPQPLPKAPRVPWPYPGLAWSPFPSVPPPAQSQDLRRQQQIQGLAQGLPGEESKVILDPQEDACFVFCLSVHALLKCRRHQWAGLARLPVSEVFCPLLPAPPSSGSLAHTSFRTALLPQAASGIDHSSWKSGQT